MARGAGGGRVAPPPAVASAQAGDDDTRDLWILERRVSVLHVGECDLAGDEGVELEPTLQVEVEPSAGRDQLECLLRDRA